MICLESRGSRRNRRIGPLIVAEFAELSDVVLDPCSPEGVVGPDLDGARRAS